MDAGQLTRDPLSWVFLEILQELTQDPQMNSGKLLHRAALQTES